MHLKSANVIGEPSSQTAFGLMFIVNVIAAPPAGKPLFQLRLLLWSRATVSAVVRASRGCGAGPAGAAAVGSWICCRCRKMLRQRQGRRPVQRSECYVSWSSRGCSSYVKRREVGLGRSTRQAGRSSGRSTTLSLRPPRSERAPTNIPPLFTHEQQRHSDCSKSRAEYSSSVRPLPTTRACRFGRTRRGRGLRRRPARRRCPAVPISSAMFDDLTLPPY